MSRMKELREGKGFNQEDFAGILGVSQQTISRIENNPTRTATDLLITMAKYYNVSTDYLLELSDEKRNREGESRILKKMEEHFDLIQDFEALSQDNQKAINGFMHVLRDIQGKSE